MSNADLYTKDTRVWIPCPDRVWKAARLLETYVPNKSNIIKLLIEEENKSINFDLSVLQISANEQSDSTVTASSSPSLNTPIVLPPLRNPDILIGQNDLTALSYLNEPEVLYNLEVRFLNSNQIYTYCGIVLVAINPYEQLPIYGNEIIKAYNGSDVQNMDPHIFAVSEEAFQRMVRFGHNQSIIVSGESGAGKTVSAKYTMRYFANVGGSGNEETQIEKRVLASNPIMEAFGNAKTTRNDNSSRFGKFLQLDFSSKHHIVGASMKTYLLEKSRVVFQASEERNYHIFYQLCAQRQNKAYLRLKLKPPSEFIYTSQGHAEQIPNVSDSEQFEETLAALRLLDFGDVEPIFDLLAAIMHLGNVKLEALNSDQCQVSPKCQSIGVVSQLLRVDEKAVRSWLCHKRIKTVGEQVVTPLTLAQALFSRDALAKHIYAQLFQWLVNQINASLSNNNKQPQTQTTTSNFIGVLDIYGFETFNLNSFEQFCINYANEKLQQQFCQHVFKLEQEEYMREEIKWSFIEFHDNQPCIELIEGRLGVLDLLDEECKMPKGSDLTWCQKLYDKHLLNSKSQQSTQGKTPQHHFSKPRMSQTAFIVIHFAENVQYQVDGFLEKNRDTVLEEQLKVLKSSESDFFSDLFSEESDPALTSYQVHRNTMPAPSKTQQQRKKTVGSQFRESLHSLMQALNSTTPHYVRCIKPNDGKAAFRFEPRRAVEQLRACGVLETVRISAAGYPSRWTYQEFFQRYRMLVKSSTMIDRRREMLRDTCQRILQHLINQADQTYQFGRTKIFFQAGQVALLEKWRAEKLRTSGICIQRHIRGWLARHKYLKMKKAALLIQTRCRGLLARRLLEQKRETRAAIVLQSAWRKYLARSAFLELRDSTIRLQSLCRGYLSRQRQKMRKEHLAAIVIQACVRGWLQKLRYKKVRRGIVQLQAHVRRRQTKKVFKTLKAQARTAEHQKKLNKGLENKIIQLQQQIEKINKERDLLQVKVQELEPLKIQCTQLKQSSAQNKDAQHKVNDLNEELLKAKLLIEQLTKEKEDLGKSNSQLEKTIRRLQQQQQQLNKSESSPVVGGHLLNQTPESESPKNKQNNEQQLILQKKLEEAQLQLAELSSERVNHQKVLAEYSRLEQRFDKVKSDLLRYQQQQKKHHIDQQKQLNGDHNHNHVNSQDDELESLIEEVKNFEANKLLYMTANGKEQMDITLLTKLHRRIAMLEAEKKQFILSTKVTTVISNSSMQHHLNVTKEDEAQDSNNNDTLQNDKDYEVIRAQELELENQKLREDLNRLRDTCIANYSINNQNNGGSPLENNPDYLLELELQQKESSRELMCQFDALNDEVQRRREECIQLKTLLVSAHRAQQRLLSGGVDQQTLIDDINGEIDEQMMVITDGNEFEVGYNSQKLLNRILENQINEMRKCTEQERDEMQRQLDKVRAENERLHALLMQQLPPDALAIQANASEIVKLTEENLELSEKCEQYSDEIKKHKKMLKVFIKRSKLANLQMDKYTNALNSSSTGSINVFNMSNINNGSMHHELLNSTIMTNGSTFTQPPLITLNNTLTSGANASFIAPQIKAKSHSSGDNSGLLEWKTEDENKILNKIIDELKPRLASNFLPGLPAYILFMCIRYADMLNDENRVRSLLSSTVHSIKKLIKKKQEDLDYFVLWLTNSCRLIHNLKQYSGERQFQLQNTAKQNSHCLKNFDLTEYRAILSDIAIWLFQGIIKDFEKKISPIIVPAILEQDSLQTSTNGLRSTNAIVVASSSSSSSSTEAFTITTLLKKLSEFLFLLNSHGVDPEIVKQIFKQLFFFIGASTFNNLVLRKEMCNWNKGIELRYSISQLEQWLRDSKLQDSGAIDTLAPIIQASRLLQARKQENDIGSICEMCPNLTIAQIQRILFMYTPSETYEEALQRPFIDKVTNQLKELRKDQNSVNQQLLIIDTQKSIFPITIPFNPSNIVLETIEVPEQFGLKFLKKI